MNATRMTIITSNTGSYSSPGWAPDSSKETPVNSKSVLSSSSPSMHSSNKKTVSSNRLPPKSPASISGRMLLSVGSNTSSSSTSRSNRRSSSSSRGSSTRRSLTPSGRRRRRGRSNSRSCKGSNSSSTISESSSSTDYSSSSDTDSSDLLTKASYIKDPSPIHLTVDTDTDDLSNPEHFSLISFEKSMRGNLNISSPSDYNVVETNNSNNNRNRRDDGNNRHISRHNNRRSHRRVRSWDSNTNLELNTGIGPSKSCLAVPKVLRRQRVLVADVASVGNASDTLVSIVETNNGSGRGRGRITGRELHETAKAAMNEGDYENALRMFEAILRAQLDRFGSEEHSSVGAALHNVGVVRLRIGEPSKAEEAFLRALAIRRNVLESGHLDLAATLAKLGSARTVLGKYDEGLHDLREALKVTRKLLGRNHRTVAQLLCHIACLYFEAGELFSAQSTFEDALDIYEGVFQDEADRDGCMAQMTETLCNIGSIQNKRKNFSGAIESFRKALDSQRGIMGHDHPRVQASLDNLAYSFSKSKLYNQALICYKEMLTAQISHFGSFTLECCDTLAKQVLIYGKLKQVDDAVQVVHEYLESVKARSEHEKSLKNCKIFKQLNQMLIDIKSAKKSSSKSKKKSAKGSRRDRSLDCFERILFDKPRSDTCGEF